MAARILFPVDLSEASPKIAPTVIVFAQKFDAEIHLLLVCGGIADIEGFQSHPSLRKLEDDLFAAAEQRLEAFQREYLKECPKVTRTVRRGAPAEEILSTIASETIDLVIMGTHGRKGLDHVVFGSVAEHIVKNSSVPVLTVNPYRQAR
jgi:nucleotide-binding universal stress UspA family protein